MLAKIFKNKELTKLYQNATERGYDIGDLCVRLDAFLSSGSSVTAHGCPVSLAQIHGALDQLTQRRLTEFELNRLATVPRACIDSYIDVIMQVVHELPSGDLVGGWLAAGSFKENVTTTILKIVAHQCDQIRGQEGTATIPGRTYIDTIATAMTRNWLVDAELADQVHFAELAARENCVRYLGGEAGCLSLVCSL